MSRSNRGYVRNNYQHKLHAKVGTGPLTVIYVDRKTWIARSGDRLKAGDRIVFRKEKSAFASLYTGIVAEETVEGGTLFITLH